MKSSQTKDESRRSQELCGDLGLLFSQLFFLGPRFNMMYLTMSRREVTLIDIKLETVINNVIFPTRDFESNCEILLNRMCRNGWCSETQETPVLGSEME